MDKMEELARILADAYEVTTIGASIEIQIVSETPRRRGLSVLFHFRGETLQSVEVAS